jgi:hypothetical protein
LVFSWNDPLRRRHHCRAIGLVFTRVFSSTRDSRCGIMPERGTVEDIMIKQIAVASFSLAAMLVGPGLASAQPPGTPAYLTTFYSDASHTTVVGHLFWNGCDYNYGVDAPHYRLSGTQTSYHDDDLAGYCYEGEMYPIS